MENDMIKKMNAIHVTHFIANTLTSAFFIYIYFYSTLSVHHNRIKKVNYKCTCSHMNHIYIIYIYQLVLNLMVFYLRGNINNSVVKRVRGKEERKVPILVGIYNTIWHNVASVKKNPLDNINRSTEMQRVKRNNIYDAVF